MFVLKYFEEVKRIAENIDHKLIDELVLAIQDLRSKKGRIFFLGVGGSAANCSHAVNDFRKLCDIECYAPVDNVSELTARTNDEGWNSVFSEWLKISKMSINDAIFILSVGGGSKEANISSNIVEAIDYSRNVGAKVFSIVGKKEGYSYKKSDISILIPNINDNLVTPHSEEFQAVVWHCLVSHPKLKITQTKWERTTL